jgi:sigma-B regulation protein RsbU (phosphoserine phosphatase)
MSTSSSSPPELQSRISLRVWRRGLTFITKPFENEELRVRLRAGERVLDMEFKLASQKKELEAAAVIQKAFLPTKLPAIEGIQFSWTFQPCDELGGDTLNIVQLGESHVGFYILDVSGHGVRASLLSVTLSRFLTPDSHGESVLYSLDENEAGGGGIVAPAKIAAVLNQRFAWTDEAEQYFTLFYGIIDVNTHELRYVLAGHPAPVLLSDDGSEGRLLDGSGLPIGLVEEAEFEEHRLQLKPGDRLFAYSDGIPEMEEPKGDPYGTERLIHALGQTLHEPLEAAVTYLSEDLDRWSSGLQSQDDISIIGVRIQ